jgi:hypothetical protein
VQVFPVSFLVKTTILVLIAFKLHDSFGDIVVGVCVESLKFLLDMDTIMGEECMDRRLWLLKQGDL